MRVSSFLASRSCGFRLDGLLGNYDYWSCSLSLGRAVQSLVYGVSTADPLIFAAVALLVLAVALIASFVPALRAAGANPMTTLRAE